VGGWVGELKVRAWNDRWDMGMNDIRPRRDGHRAGWKDGWKRMCRADTGARRDRDEDGDWGTERERERADIGHERASERAEWERLRWGGGGVR